MATTLHPLLGPPAVDALGAAIAEAKGDDRLAPVTVAVPSTYAGLSLRRRLGARPGGLVNVGFVSLGRVAELLGAATLAALGRRPLSAAMVTEAVRSVLATEPGIFGPVASHPATEQRLARGVTELRSCSPDGLDRITAGSLPARELVRITRLVRSRVEVGWYDEHDLAAAAVDAVRAGEAPALADVGHVITFCLRHVPPSMQALLDALGTGVTVIDPDLQPPPATADLVVAAPDPDEEVRTAIRLLMARVEADPAVPLHRMALLYPVEQPYALIAHQQLAAAGIPFNGPAGRRLRETITGTALLRLLALPDGDFRRDDVMAWLASAPVLERPRSEPAPAGAWDTISKRAGVVAGGRQWQQRLAGHIARLLEQRGAGEDATGRRAAHIEHEVERTERLQLFIDELTAALTPPVQPAWTAFGTWAVALLDRYLGADTRHGRWPEEEQDAWRSVRDAVRRLGGLDAMGGDCELAVFRRALEQELDAPAGRTGTFGTGVLVAPVGAAAGIDLDTVFVLGMAEGAFPAIGADDAVLPEADRALAGGELRGRQSRLEDDHHALSAALAAARERVLLWPRAELRRGRASLPSRWLPAGTAATLDVDSVEDGLRRPAAPASLVDRDLAALLAWTGAGAPASDHFMGAELPRLGRGWGVIAARQSDAFTRFDGNVDARPAAGMVAGAALSPTSLESYATCPMQYFLSRVLRLGGAERPEEILSITALDKGTLVHRSLEEYVLGLLDGQQPSLERLLAIAERNFDDLEAKGLAGKPVLWRYEREVMRRELKAFSEGESFTPLAAELAFGIDGFEPVELALPDGSVLGFRGRADRVDDDGDGGLVVTDYKTGRGYGYDAIALDPVDRGRHLQLPLYGLAARQRFGPDRPVLSRYQMVSERAGYKTFEVDVSDDVVARLREVTEVIVTGVSSGAFLARPGDAHWQGGWKNCTYCDFDRLCLEGRDVHWDAKKRATPALEAYVNLSEGGDDD